MLVMLPVKTVGKLYVGGVDSRSGKKLPFGVKVNRGKTQLSAPSLPFHNDTLYVVIVTEKPVRLADLSVFYKVPYNAAAYHPVIYTRRFGDHRVEAVDLSHRPKKVDVSPSFVSERKSRAHNYVLYPQTLKKNVLYEILRAYL